jgi:hypothetical protein
MSSIVVTLGWASLIVIAELIAFYLIQKNVDDQSGWFHSNIIISVLLFGIVVTFSFRQILSGGTNIPIANLYWILLSQFGAIIMAFAFFNQQIETKDWIAIVLLFTSFLVTYML